MPQPGLEVKVARWKRQLGALVPHRYQLVLYRDSKRMDIKKGWDASFRPGEVAWLVRLATNLTLKEGQFLVHQAEEVLFDPAVQEVKVWVPEGPGHTTVAVFDGPMRKLRDLRGGRVHRVKWKRVFRTIKQVKQATRPLRPRPVVPVPVGVEAVDLVVRSWGHCWYCGELLSENLGRRGAGQREHQLPRSRGGKAGLNLVLSCEGCNQQKGTLNLAEYRQCTTPLPRAAGGEARWPQVFFGEALLHLLIFRWRLGEVPPEGEMPLVGFPAAALGVLEHFWGLPFSDLKGVVQQHRVFRSLLSLSREPEVDSVPENRSRSDVLPVVLLEQGDAAD